MILNLLALASSTNTLLIALLIPILGFVSPFLIAKQINNNTRESKQQDWDRQDIVAERAEAVAIQAAKAAELVIQRQESIDAKTDEVARLVASSTNLTNTQLEKIHGLVNSQYTEAIKSELSANKDTLTLMGELIDSKKKTGVEPTMEILSAYKSKEEQIAILEATILARKEADEQSKLVNIGPREVIIMNDPEKPVPVVDAPTTPTQGETT